MGNRENGGWAFRLVRPFPVTGHGFLSSFLSRAKRSGRTKTPALTIDGPNSIQSSVPAKLGDYAATLQKSAHVLVEGTLRSNPYQVEAKSSTAKKPIYKTITTWYIRPARMMRSSRRTEHNGPMATVSAPRLLTAKEYGQLDEVLGFRDELIEGERVLSPTPKLAHGWVIENLERIIRPQLGDMENAADLSSTPLRIEREAGWKFRINNVDSVPEPDLMVVRAEDARRAAKSNDWFDSVPLLVIEVISPSERKAKRMQKVGLYLEMGVPYVIEVDYKRRVVLVHTPAADTPKMYAATDKLSTPFCVAVSEIFAILD